MNDLDTFELEIRSGKFFEGTLSDETPVDRGDFDEILLTTPSSYELHTAQLPLLDNHDPNKQIGVVEGIRVVGKKLIGKLRFTNDEYAQNLKKDVEDGIRQNLSIGYQIMNAFFDDLGRKIVDKYKILEASLVPIPANPNAGIGRCFSVVDSDLGLNYRTLIFKDEKPMEKIESRKDKRTERERVTEILGLAERHNLRELGYEWIEEGRSLDSFRAAVMEAVNNDYPLQLGEAPRSYEAREYSIKRAIEGLKDPSKRGFEFEVSKDLERSMPRTSSDSVLIPFTRTMTSGTAGASTIATNIDSRIQDFIQAKSIAQNLGSQSFSGLMGDLQIPVGSSASGATVLVTDGTTQSAETTPTLTSVTLSPTRIADVIPISYGFLQQSTPDVESYLRRLIANTFASTFDAQVLAGSGSGGNVEGVINKTGINNVEYSNGGNPTFANLLALVSALGADNVDLTGLKWVIHPDNMDNLQTVVKFSSTASPLLDINPQVGGQIGTMLGYPVFVSSNMTAGTYLLGDFSHHAVGYWGGLEVKMNEFYDDRRFISSLNAIYSFDAAVLQANAFGTLTEAAS